MDEYNSLGRLPRNDWGQDPDNHCPLCGDDIADNVQMCFSCRAAIGRGLDRREARLAVSIEYKLREHAHRMKAQNNQE